MGMGQLLPLTLYVYRQIRTKTTKIFANSHVSRAENISKCVCGRGLLAVLGTRWGNLQRSPGKGHASMVKRVGGKRDEGRVRKGKQREGVKGETADGQERREDVPKGGDELCPLANIPAGANRAISSILDSSVGRISEWGGG